MSSVELCKKAEIQYQTFNKILKGGKGRTKTIGRIAAALEVDVLDIIETERA